MTTFSRRKLSRLFHWSDQTPPVTERLEALLRARFPQARAWSDPEGDVALPAPRDPALVRRLKADLGDAVRDDVAARVQASRGLALDDLVSARLGLVDSVPDVVVGASSEEAIEKLLASCAEADAPVIPRGGGTSVTGAVNGATGAVVLDLSMRLHGVDPVRVDDGLLTARAGTLGPVLEAAANAAGFTIGHFPQSFEKSTLGGWIAARSAGQMSSHYGRADELVVGLRAVTPAGPIVVLPRAASAVGPDMLQVLAGSEGALGVITEATLRLHPHHQRRFMGAYLAPGFAAGVEMVRALSRDGLSPAALRLSDEAETERLLAMAKLPPGGETLLSALARRRGAALLLVVAEGPAAHVAWLAARVRWEALRAQAVPLGAGPVRHWWKTRFAQPALRDALLDRGILIDTLETAAPWSQAAAVVSAVREVLAACDADAGAHVSHVYPDGCSLYFTYLMAPAPEAAQAHIVETRAAVARLLLARGCPLSHHHGSGRLLAPFVEQQIGSTAAAGLRAFKQAVDPKGVLNPGLPWGAKV